MKRYLIVFFALILCASYKPVFNPADVEIAMRGTAGGPNNNRIRIWSGIVVPTVAMGQAIDYSAAGFTTVTNVSVIPQRQTTDVGLVPNVALNSVPTATSCTLNITQPNTATVVILGINVLSGLPIIAATNLSSISLYIRVEGY